MSDIDNFWDEISDIWQKRRNEEDLRNDRVVFDKYVRTEEDFQKLKDLVEATQEDTPIHKLPSLYKLINKLFKKEDTKTTDSTPSQYVAYQAPIQDDSEAKKLFWEVWDIWPESLDFVESPEMTLKTFLEVSRSVALTDIRKACIAYSEHFNEGASGAFPKSLKGFLKDKEYFGAWLERAESQAYITEFDRKQFEAAYAWYPDFSNKQADRTKKQALNSWWRRIPKDDRLEFLIACKSYAEDRDNEAYVQEMSDEEKARYTKSFSTFVLEWKECVDIDRLLFNRRDFTYPTVVKTLAENGLDIHNFFGNDCENFWYDKCYPRWLQLNPFDIKSALRKAFQQAKDLPLEWKNNPALYFGKNRNKADEESARLDVLKMLDIVMEKLISTKSIEMPR